MVCIQLHRPFQPERCVLFDPDGDLEIVESGVAIVRVCRVGESGPTSRSDAVAIEEPLEIRVGFDAGARRMHRAISVTMRTPGDDEELAVGFLFTEGIIAEPAMVNGVRSCSSGRSVRVDLRRGVDFNFSRLERHFYAASSCGVCGKASLDAVRVYSRHRPPRSLPVLSPAVILHLPERLRAAQAAFDRTGGLHAAGLFDPEGELIALREDVGRHNAVDKLVGWAFLKNMIPLHETILMVSGRASFELVQKAAMAGIPLLAAVGAPSSLAVELAHDQGLTLLGFVRDDRFNIYAGAERVSAEIQPRRSASGSSPSKST